MMKLTSNDEIDKKKKAEEKKTGIQKKKLTDTNISKYISSENIYILTFRC